MSMTATRSPSASRDLQVTTFRLGELLLGLEISAIREVSRLGAMTPVPSAPVAVRGVINLRGDVVTVLDLRAILGLCPALLTSASRLLIVTAHDELIGMLVDGVEDVVGVTEENREDLPANAGHFDSRFFRCVYKLESELLVLLDIVAVLAHDSAGR
jgi:purine-binding chemotaxis protein CheW